MVCLFTKYVISVPVPVARSTTLSHAVLINCVLVNGTPSQLISDNAFTFSSSFFQQYCNLLYINKRCSAPYHSAGNGTVERTFRTFRTSLPSTSQSKILTLTNFYHLSLFTSIRQSVKRQLRVVTF